jgi:hypothetical protein
MARQNEFHLKNGRSIYLEAINQSFTYGRLLAGLPTKELNYRIIESDLESALDLWHNTAYLIVPIEIPIETSRKYPFGTPARIPDVACIARFKCYDPVRDPSMDGSGLAIVWFQQQFAFPVDEWVAEQIRALDWDRHAFDFLY